MIINNNDLCVLVVIRTQGARGPHSHSSAVYMYDTERRGSSRMNELQSVNCDSRPNCVTIRSVSFTLSLCRLCLPHVSFRPTVSNSVYLSLPVCLSASVCLSLLVYIISYMLRSIHLDWRIFYICKDSFNLHIYTI